MSVNRRISSALVMIFVLLLSTILPAAAANSLMENYTAVFTTIDFVSNIETIGVAVSGSGLPPTAALSYRQSGESLWHSGHTLMRIDDGRLIGSLFNLSPATSYDIKVFDGSSEINGSVSTQPDQLSFTPSVILNVNDDALPGGNGSATAPFRTIQEAVNHAGLGTQVLVADGIYREAVTFPNSGTAGNWIQVKAAGSAAILDSADRLSGDIWTLYSTSHVWFTKISGPVAYLARDGKRYYQYDDRTGLMQAIGHGGVTMNEGWYYEPSTLRLYVRSLDNPASHTWQLPRLNHAFDLAARDWIWIEGFEIQFYGTTTNGCGVCTINASHIVIRRNKIHNMQLGVFINWTGTEDQGNDTRIEQNEVYDPLVNEWPWTAVKGSFMEGTGIIVRGHIGAIVHDNNVHNFFNGIYTGSSGALENPELAFDADIYNNYIHHISDDGLEPEGACINQRFRNNTVDMSFIGISLAPITQGPTWVLRSAFTNFTGRGIKFADNSDGIVLIYQNTGWTNANNINGMDLITSIHNVKMRNNIFQSTGYSFAEVPTGSTANDWNHDNWYTIRGSTGPHFKWENVNYNAISALCTASGLECNGYENFPGFANPTGGDFTLLSSSPNIDRGVVIPGINDDFVGNAPDVGAYEFAFDPPPTVLSSVRANSNPTNAANVGFTVTFSKLVTGVNNSDFVLTNAGVTGASVTNISGSGTIYTVTVNTGSGNGTIRLDVVDDDSIRDGSNHPLGGNGIGNGNFISGETYTINKPTNVDVNIGGELKGQYFLAQNESTRQSYVSTNNGPVKITNTETNSMIAAERVIYKVNGTPTSFSEMMGLPNSQLDNIYWFPWYNNVDLDTQLRFGNVSGTDAHVHMFIGGAEITSGCTPSSPYTLAPGASLRVSCTSVNNGPVQISSDVNIVAAERVIYNVNGVPTSFTEMMGLPNSQLDNTYWMPWYNNVDLDTQLRFGNVSGSTATVHVFIGTSEMINSPFTLSPGESTQVSFPAVNNGPVQIVSDVNIVAAERVIYKFNGTLTSFSEMMGLPDSQLNITYWMPWYNNVDLDTQLRFGNVSETPAHINVYINNLLTLGSPFTLDVGQSMRVSFANVNNGPVEVVSDIPIVAAERVIYKVGGVPTSFSEMMGLPNSQLNTTYWMPWYNNVDLDTQLRFGVP